MCSLSERFNTGGTCSLGYRLEDAARSLKVPARVNTAIKQRYRACATLGITEVPNLFNSKS